MKSFYYLLFTIFLFGCVTKEDNYLNKGLTELKNHRVVNEDLIDGITIKKFGIIKSEEKEDEYKLVFLLNNDVKKEDVENYSVTIRAVPTDEEITMKRLEKKEFLWDFKPILINKNEHNYIITSVKTDIKKLKEIRFALYHRDGFQGKILSKIITVRNLSLY